MCGVENHFSLILSTHASLFSTSSLPHSHTPTKSHPRTQNPWNLTSISPSACDFGLVVRWVKFGEEYPVDSRFSELGFAWLSLGFVLRLWGRDFSLLLCVYVLILCLNSALYGCLKLGVHLWKIWKIAAWNQLVSIPFCNGYRNPCLWIWHGIDTKGLKADFF